MKTYSLKTGIAVFSVSAVILAFFIISPARGQEPVKKITREKVMVKVVTDDNGVRTVIDTTFEMPDSMAMDSVKNEIERLVRIGKDAREQCFRFRGWPHEYSFDFQMPDLSEYQKDLKELEEIELPEWDEQFPDRAAGEESLQHPRPSREHRMIIRTPDRKQTLSDVLGDIPMDRVISYSIKDRKNGKRIVIDLSDEPGLP